MNRAIAFPAIRVRGVPLYDAAFVGALLVVAQLLNAGQGGGYDARKAAFLIPLVLACLWRRRAPLLAGVVLLACLPNDALFAPKIAECAVTLPALFLVAYATGAWLDLRHARIGLAIALGCAVEIAVSDVVFAPWNALPLGVLTAVVWIAGRAVRKQAAMGETLRLQGAELERTRDERLRLALEVERARVGSEIHLTVGQSVRSMLQNAAGAGDLAWIAAEGRSALEQMRRVLGGLRADHGLGQSETRAAERASALRTAELAASRDLEQDGPGRAARLLVFARRLSSRRVDAVLGVSLAVAAAADQLSGTSNRVATLVGLVLLGAAVALRHARTWASLTSAIVALLVLGATGALNSDDGPILASYILVLWSVASLESARNAWTGAVAGTAAFEVASYLGPQADWVPPLTIGVPVWLAGRILAARRKLTAELRVRTLELEHERSELVHLAVQRERSHLARELHDIAAHHVYTMIVQADLGLAGRRTESEALVAVRESAAEAMDELDRLLGVLSADPPGPDVAGIVRRAERLGIAVDADLGAGVEGLSAETRHVLARLVQEGLTNALKHAGPTSVRVSLERAADAITVAVEDRGPAPGRDPRPPTGGYGLGGMRARVEDLGGRLSFGRTGPGGWRLQADIPLAGPTSAELRAGS